MGAPHLAACGGAACWEVRIVAAVGFVCVGMAGISFRSGPQAQKDAVLGDDEASWALFVHRDQRRHE